MVENAKWIEITFIGRPSNFEVIERTLIQRVNVCKPRWYNVDWAMLEERLQNIIDATSILIVDVAASKIKRWNNVVYSPEMNKMLSVFSSIPFFSISFYSVIVFSQSHFVHICSNFIVVNLIVLFNSFFLLPSFSLIFFIFF